MSYVERARRRENQGEERGRRRPHTAAAAPRDLARIGVRPIVVLEACETSVAVAQIVGARAEHGRYRGVPLPLDRQNRLYFEGHLTSVCS